MAQAIRTGQDLTPEAVIRSLAEKHGISPERTATDDWADVITRLAGDEVIADEVEDLIVNLRRKGIISAKEATALYGDYLARA